MNRQLCCYQNRFWVVTGSDAKTNALIIALPDADEMLLVDSADVLFMRAEEAIALANNKLVSAKLNNSHLGSPPQDPTQATTNTNTISQKQILDASRRHLAISMDIEGSISPQGAAELCNLSLSRYYQVKHSYDPKFGFRALVSQQRGRKPKPIKPYPTTQPITQSTRQSTTQTTPPTAEAPSTSNPAREGKQTP
ncbi:hypothetical protein ACIQRH_01340 [Pseudomonas sp. NPDC090964]|uniref:hypothetical protein n=1 Tax=Pseudomonas sp. NPDC090964 TaxID=3364482 RepID=UPI00380B4F76